MFGHFLTKLYGQKHSNSQYGNTPLGTAADISDIDPQYEMLAPYSLGTFETEQTKRRTRKSIYTTWRQMQRDPTIAAALNLHVTAALGGHESRGDTVFMSPSALVEGPGRRARELRAMVEKESTILTPLFNACAFSVCRHAVSYGDGYARPFGAKGHGLLEIQCDEHTEPPLIQAFEQAGRTVGFHVLEQNEYQNLVTRLTTLQMARMKMPRYAPVPQFSLLPLIQSRLLKEDDISKVPIIPSPVGGSVLYDAEESWENVQLLLAAMNTQQIADSVKQAFLTVDMSGMPRAHQQKYQEALTTTLKTYSDQVMSALKGGKSIWASAWHVLPVWGDKQILNPIGELAQRGVPLNSEQLMLHVRRMAGALGQDMSLLGWADQLAGGIGDGASFQTNARAMQMSIHIRQAHTIFQNAITNIHWFYKYGYCFKPTELPWKFEYYSDMTAASTEQLTNKQTRANTLALTNGAIQSLKDLGLSKKSNKSLLTDIGGFDDDKAEQIAQDLANQPKPEDVGQDQGPPPDEGGNADNEDYNPDEEDM